MSMMPCTARKLLWNPGSLGKRLGEVCLEAFDNKEDEFGKTVIDILESSSLIEQEISSYETINLTPN